MNSSFDMAVNREKLGHLCWISIRFIPCSNAMWFYSHWYYHFTCHCSTYFSVHVSRIHSADSLVFPSFLLPDLSHTNFPLTMLYLLCIVWGANTFWPIKCRCKVIYSLCTICCHYSVVSHNSLHWLTYQMRLKVKISVFRIWHWTIKNGPCLGSLSRLSSVIRKFIL
jgi:hypothetical protein